jgi:hypothetical protein
MYLSKDPIDHNVYYVIYSVRLGKALKKQEENLGNLGIKFAKNSPKEQKLSQSK